VTWTRFNDTNSGGQQKTAFTEIVIEAPKDRAVEIFEARFPGVSPYFESCECCGEDFMVGEYPERPVLNSNKHVLWVAADGTESAECVFTFRLGGRTFDVVAATPEQAHDAWVEYCAGLTGDGPIDTFHMREVERVRGVEFSVW
jgi:hypothetical protein